MTSSQSERSPDSTSVSLNSPTQSQFHRGTQPRNTLAYESIITFDNDNTSTHSPQNESSASSGGVTMENSPMEGGFMDVSRPMVDLYRGLRLEDLSDPLPGRPPEYPMHVLMQVAIQSSPYQRLRQCEIRDALIERFPYFATAGRTWRNTLRHALTNRASFYKVPKPPHIPGRGSYWAYRFTRETKRRTRSGSKRDHGSPAGSDKHTPTGLTDQEEEDSDSADGENIVTDNVGSGNMASPFLSQAEQSQYYYSGFAAPVPSVPQQSSGAASPLLQPQNLPVGSIPVPMPFIDHGLDRRSPFPFTVHRPVPYPSSHYQQAYQQGSASADMSTGQSSYSTSPVSLSPTSTGINQPQASYPVPALVYNPQWATGPAAPQEQPISFQPYPYASTSTDAGSSAQIGTNWAPHMGYSDTYSGGPPPGSVQSYGSAATSHSQYSQAESACVGAGFGALYGLAKRLPPLPYASASGLNSGIAAFTFFGLREYAVAPALRAAQFEPPYSTGNRHIIDSASAGALTGAILNGARYGRSRLMSGAVAWALTATTLQFAYNEASKVIYEQPKQITTSLPAHNAAEPAGSNQENGFSDKVMKVMTWVAPVRKLSDEEYLEAMKKKQAAIEKKLVQLEQEGIRSTGKPREPPTGTQNLSS
ncbi:hypothetical protein FRB99_000520 [Tulasnella sp. 403]|nr:hypothetical protein FRB99_000520 [Tulasnella sp. 403]